MKNKVWHKTVIVTENQNIDIYPEEMFDGIIVEAKERDDKTASPCMYLNADEMELLISKMREMMNYVIN
jgi:tRNA pseudouridine-54 N-methylase